MTEINDSPFIKDKEYLLKHDLCEIPELSDQQQLQDINNKNFRRNKNYINEAIIIFNFENYNYRENRDLIQAFYRAIEKEISNNFILLNKRDQPKKRIYTLNSEIFSLGPKAERKKKIMKKVQKKIVIK